MNELPKKNNYKIRNIKKALKLYNIEDIDIESFISSFKKNIIEEKPEVINDADKN